MNIAILGATGMAGSRLNLEAMRRGHDVTAYARNNHAVAERSYDVVAVEATSPAAMERLARDHDVLVLATRPHPGEETDAALVATTVLDAAYAGRRVIPIPRPRSPR
ncbi:NAD(P)H-binding protein [Dermacoccus sp. PAMC28757]|uniref:NAD(P)H-binding protein n=1 Tax=Dermacoccus sp. PAMC28757 TaxID=2762331 RepID=UPI00164E08BA|nr:NAD(P)H-binding protein [Dermacoccus sp. PAMC28757]QNK53413.1 NAD(P)H-binding protein [Dermacoccus sp. PAMC28757]